MTVHITVPIIASVPEILSIKCVCMWGERKALCCLKSHVCNMSLEFHLVPNMAICAACTRKEEFSLQDQQFKHTHDQDCF